jgi:indolepyruvate ferredoxin oxidoreductase
VEERLMADAGSSLRSVTLDDKYDLTKERVFITGTQAVIRLLLMQRERDRLAGLEHGGLRLWLPRLAHRRPRPEPLRGQEVARALQHRLPAGLNEELAATAVWGSQQAEMRGEGKYDGVFGMWYGKGPGVDRSATCSATPTWPAPRARRRAGAHGRRPHGGILHRRAPVRVPLRRRDDPDPEPGGVQEILDYGLYGYAMSRFCGSWVASSA